MVHMNIQLNLLELLTTIDFKIPERRLYEISIKKQPDFQLYNTK